MVEHRNPFDDVTAPDLSVRVDRTWSIAALRQFDRRGSYAEDFKAWSGAALPSPRQALVPAWPGKLSAFVLAWRSPTEVWALTMAADAFSHLLTAHEALLPSGCCVDQTGGLWVLKTTGAKVTDLLVRIGSSAAAPPLGAAHVSRIAEVTVQTICVNEGEMLLVVDRAYAEHVLGWIRITAGDL